MSSPHPSEPRLRSILDHLNRKGETDPAMYQALSEALEAWVEDGQGAHPVDWLGLHVRGGLEHTKTLPDAGFLAAQIERLPGEALMLSKMGGVVALNAAARARFGCQPGDTMRSLGFAPDHVVRQLERHIESGRATGLLLPSSADGQRSWQGLMVIGRTPFADIFLLWHPGHIELPPVAESFREAFALSAREMEILCGLVMGESAGSLASMSGRSVGTVRQQIKSLLAKLGVGSQVEAVALVARAGYMLAACPALRVESVSSDAVSHAAFLAADGRVVAYRRWGSPWGVPVLVVHGALFGIAELDAERTLARQMGLMCLAMERPGYGRTQFPQKGDVQQVMLDDAIALLDHVGVKRCVVLAHDVGTVIAMRLAERAPERIAAIVAAPVTPPMEGWRQTAHMPASLRIHAFASQRFPRLTDILVDLGMRHVRQAGFQSFPKLVFKDCPHDLEIWNAPERLHSAAGACALIAAQDAQGFKHDMHLTNQDWRELAQRVRVTVHLLHGRRSQTVCAQAVERLHQQLAQSSLEIVEDAGHSLPLSHFPMVLERVRALADVHIKA